MIPFAPPLDPDADEARRLLEEELSTSEYLVEGQSMPSRFMEWLNDLIGSLLESANDGGGIIVLVGLVAVIALVAFAIWRSVGAVRIEQRVSTGAVFTDLTASAAHWRVEADRLSSAGDLSAAVVARFRAIARAAEERALVTEMPGRTAQEYAAELARRLPTLADRLGAAASLFDACCYSERIATRADYDEVVSTDQAMAAARPQAVGSAT